jgi:hypothetical protein
LEVVEDLGTKRINPGILGQEKEENDNMRILRRGRLIVGMDRTYFSKLPC